jgi:AcrR family transcriptional regulator
LVRRPEHLGYPDFDDLPETAQRIVDAARRLLVARGWSALTIPAIAREAGVYTPAINYYFGSKAGLVAMIFDSIMRGTVTATRESLADIERADDRVLAIAEAILSHPEIIGQETDVAFFETLPHLVREAPLRERTLERYRAWEDAAIEALREPADGVEAAAVRPYAMMLLAMIDGLSIRKLLEPDSPAAEDALRLFIRLLELRLHAPEARA